MRIYSSLNSNASCENLAALCFFTALPSHRALTVAAALPVPFLWNTVLSFSLQNPSLQAGACFVHLLFCGEFSRKVFQKPLQGCFSNSSHSVLTVYLSTFVYKFLTVFLSFWPRFSTRTWANLKSDQWFWQHHLWPKCDKLNWPFALTNGNF